MKFVLLVLAFAAVAAAQNSAPAFYDSRADYNVSGAFAIADFNGDGYPDIAASDATDTIVIYLNDGTGNFHKFAAIAGSPASSLVAGDFNNDGIPDIAFIANESVGIVLGAGDGTLRDYYTYSGVYAYNGDIKAVDMNHDGKLDVIVEDAIIFGNGDGTFNGQSATGCNSAFDVKDMNADGSPDLVCSVDNAGKYELQVFLNNGAGSLQAGPASPMPANASAASIAIGDVDGNGTNDVVAVSSAYFVVFLNSGTGVLTGAHSYPLVVPSDDVKLADVNGDGHLDALYSQVSTNTIHPAQNLAIWTGNGTGAFASYAAYATAGADSRIVLSDLRKRGLNDIVTGSQVSYTTLFNFGNNTFDDGLYIKIPQTRLGSAVSADFNHDGIPDLAVSVLTNVKSPEPSDNQLSGAYILLGTGKPLTPFTTGQRLFIPPDVAAMATGDFNKDGNPDLAVLTGQRLVIYTGNGDGTFSMGATYPSTALGLTVGDFNGDGNLDIATSGVYIFTGAGDGTFKSSLAFVAVGPYILSADLNGDGILDLIATLGTGSDFEVALGKGNGRFGTPVPYSQETLSLTVGDFNGDGLPDIAVLTNYSIVIWTNSSRAPGTFGVEDSIPIVYDGVPVNLVSADFNGDGITDLATADIDLEVLTGTGTGTFNPPSIYGGADYPDFLLSGNVLLNNSGHPSVITVGGNSAISFFNNITK